MPTYLTDAFTLRNFPLGENDRIVVLLTPEGLKRAVAKGARKSGSSLGGRTEPLLRCKFLLAKGKNLDVISQCETIQAFSPLRRDLDRLLYGLSLAKLTMNCLGEQESDFDLFDSFGRALAALCSLHPPLVSLWYELHLLSILGYAPSLEACVHCGTPVEEDCRFSPAEGGVLCPRCGGGLRLSGLALRLLHDLQTLEAEDLEGVSVEEAVLFNAQNVLRKHLEQRIETRLKSTVLL